MPLISLVDCLKRRIISNLDVTVEQFVSWKFFNHANSNFDGGHPLCANTNRNVPIKFSLNDQKASLRCLQL